jgi:DNA-binding response OmpR family regulator
MVAATSEPGDLGVFGNVQVDPGSYRVTICNRPVELTFLEFELLIALCRQVDRVVNYDALCQAFWYAKGKIERRRLKVLISRLRSKLGASSPYRIETVRGTGYGFMAAS